MSEPPDDDDDDVGYGRPPKKNRFKKGDRANPNGRPKGSKDKTSLFKKTLDRPVYMTLEGKKTKVSYSEAFLSKISQDSLQKDKAAVNIIISMIKDDISHSPNIDEKPPALLPFIIKKYGEETTDALNITFDNNNCELVRSWVVEVALARMSPDEIALLEFDAMV